MIYLIEDKTSRRNDYGWSDEKVSSLSDVLTIIDNASMFLDSMNEIQEEGNVVLYHESFTIRETYEKAKRVEDFIYYLENVKNIHIAFFSGSKNQRKNFDKTCDLNVAPLYTNLDVFINYYKQGIVDFRYLLFGDNPEIEKEILTRIRKVNNENIDTTKVSSPQKILAFRTIEDYIQFPISNALIIDGCDYDCSDKDFIKIVKDQSLNQYDAIYIPLCMGETLSDFLGLRLAMFFRLCDTVNKYTHLFIYGDIDFSLFVRNECAEILKMPGVNYISAASNKILESLKLIQRIKLEDYQLGLKNIHLNVPSNIGDNHSIANKWAKYRWSSALDVTDEGIEEDNEVIDSILYFKYLAAMYPPTKISTIDKENLKIENNGNNPELNILYVDDEADDGWYKLLFHIIYDENDIKNFDYLGRELKSMTQEEIISYVMNRIKESDVNVVILDLRLHPGDFNETNIENITGFKLLKMIKNHNRGIQVLMFSATNKVWNLQALQEEEVDGFIMKEAPENSADPDFTVQSINHLVNLLKYCNERSFLKEFWFRLDKLICKIELLLKFEDVDNKFGNNILSLLEIAEDHLFSRNSEFNLDSCFISLFRIIELAGNEWIKSKWDGSKWHYSFKENGDPLYFFEEDSMRPLHIYWPDVKKLPYEQKIKNTLYYVGSNSNVISKLVNKRNRFTHPDKSITYFNVRDLVDILTISEKIINSIKSE